MKVRVVAFGQRMPAWVDAAWSDYARRVPREWNLELVELRPEPRDRGRTTTQVLASEAARMRTACKGLHVVALDERGEAWSTRRLADTLVRWRDAAVDAAFVIGSADGLDPAFRDEAAATWSLSALTLPHGLVRILVVEQIYRASALLSGHPYHRE